MQHDVHAPHDVHRELARSISRGESDQASRLLFNWFGAATSCADDDELVRRWLLGQVLATTATLDGRLSAGTASDWMAVCEAVATWVERVVEYLRAVRDAVACHDHEWRQNNEGDGWYVWEKGTPLAFDGCEMPHNQFLALATLVDDGPHRERAVRMLTAFRNDLEVHGNSYVWKYWWIKGRVYNGYSQSDDVSEWTPAFNGARQVEDGSHGKISVE